MKDNIIFKLLSKEDICGKTRNIYIKMNKNSSRITKTKFIKYKGEFVKLTYFIKEHRKNKKQSNNYKNNIIIINNINDIKDLKIRKHYKKNAKIYIFTENNKKGGGHFTTDVLRNSERGIQRTIIPPTPSSDHNEIEIRYDKKIDDIIVELENKLNKQMFYELINNFWYYITMDDFNFERSRCVIRPHIKYFNYDKIIIDFYFSIDNREWVDWGYLNHNWNDLDIDYNIKRGTPYGGRKWIKMPIHITLFFSVTKKQGWMNEYYISKHIHITSEQIKNFNIKTVNGLKENNNKTHTYLIANNLEKMLDIMKDHGKNIFKDWVYDKNVSQTDNEIKIVCPFPQSGDWNIMNPKIISKLNFQKVLTEDEKKLLCACINNSLYLIIYDIINHLIRKEYANEPPGDPYNRHNLYTPEIYHKKQLMIVRGSECIIERTYNDENVSTYFTTDSSGKKHKIMPIEFIKFINSENNKEPGASYASYIDSGEIKRESLVKLENEGVSKLSSSTRTDSPSLRSPERSRRTDSASFRSPERSGTTDNPSLRSPERSRRTDNPSLRSPGRSRRTDSSSFRSPERLERTASIMETLGTTARTATRTAFGTISSIASSAIPTRPERTPSARDFSPGRRPSTRGHY